MNEGLFYNRPACNTYKSRGIGILTHQIFRSSTLLYVAD
jgi:hypothetical protein